MKLPEPIGRALRRFSATRPGARVFRALLPPMDRVVTRLTNGKQTFTGMVLPTLTLVSTGRKSGQPRHNPLIYVDTDDGYAVVGTNWGQEHHPAWTHNLLANPSGTVEVDGQSVPVTARLTGGDEHDQLYARFEAMSPNYTKYKDWSGGREIRLFVLEPDRA